LRHGGHRDNRPIRRLERQTPVGPERLRRLLGNDLARHCDEIDQLLALSELAGRRLRVDADVDRRRHGGAVVAGADVEPGRE
jgi:hypothetical protein